MKKLSTIISQCKLKKLTNGDFFDHDENGKTYACCSLGSVALTINPDLTKRDDTLDVLTDSYPVLNDPAVLYFKGGVPARSRRLWEYIVYMNDNSEMSFKEMARELKAVGL